jgi:MoxR-like ATPase
MEFYCYETGQTIAARHRPVVVITSNNEKELPDAFLRRCLFHYIRFPDRPTMDAILKVHYPNLDQKLITSAMRLFYELRDTRGLKKKPSTSELIDWIKLLIMDRMEPEQLNAVNLREALPPHLHALIKNEVDLSILESLGRGLY